MNELFAQHHHAMLKFPKNFVWGTSTSAHQIEGGNTNSWSAWEQNPKHIWNGEHSGHAARGYELFETDARNAAALHNNAYRMSIEWSRIEPGRGVFNEQELIHYREVINAFRARGMKIMLTLHHFTNPIWFEERGGWERWDAPALFGEFVEHVTGALGDLVDWWITINEPAVYAGLGYVRGVWPPGKKSKLATARVLFQLRRAHIRAYKIIHAYGARTEQHTPVSAAMNMFSFSSYQHSLFDMLYVRFLDFRSNHIFISGAKKYFDFIALNYYFHKRLERKRGKFFTSLVDARMSEQRETNDIGWEIYPQGIGDVLTDLWSSYHLPIYVTENGLSTENDDKRARFIVAYVKEIYLAIQAGVDVRGYFYWSLIDNFEWEKGFTPRFGLYHVDYHTGKRRAKPSARVYAQIAKDNGIRHEMQKFLGHEISVREVL